MVKRVRNLLLAIAVAVPLVSQTMIDDSFLSRLLHQYGDEAYQRGVALQRLLRDLDGATEDSKLHEINNFFNAFSYAEDSQQWNQKDYWATPEEFIGTNRGDCEDYVIAKYFALRDAGISDAKLFLTYVKATKLNVAHMVLTYFDTPGSVPLVLDNYDLRVLPATDRKDLLPVYSFNANSFFLTDLNAGLGQRVPQGKITNKKWVALLGHLREAQTNDAL